jgi:ATP-dependent Clp protease adaptor protein ClpS
MPPPQGKSAAFALESACRRGIRSYLINRRDWRNRLETGQITIWPGGSPVFMMIFVEGSLAAGPVGAMTRYPSSIAVQPVAPVRLAGDDRKTGEPGNPGTAVITKTKPQTKRPSLYRVLILNDDYTPMEFVVQVLEKFFGKDSEAATRIMLHVHHHGIGECGVYTYEVAETKVTQVMDFARKHQHPLQCVME